MNFILKIPGNTKFKERRSEFVSYSKPINNTDELNELIKSLKSTHPTARHFCWAYRIHHNGKIIENSSDAGEPSGSAGAPILNVLRSNGLVNCTIIVIRYFGGIKLGKRGLIDAYKTAGELVIAESEIIKWEPVLLLKLMADIKLYGIITSTVKKFNGRIIADYSSEALEIVIELKTKDYKKFDLQFSEITQNTGKIKKQSEHDQTKEVRK